MQGPLAKSKNTPPSALAYNPPAKSPPVILYVDEDIIVLSKPSGLLSVPGKPELHRDSLETRIREDYPAARTVHRLDRGTSGVFIMALNANAHRHLGRQFEKRQTAKTYIALVDGQVAEECGIIDLALRTDWYNRPKQMVDKCLGREAVTRWKILERYDSSSRIELKPETGRSHQLRVHMMEMGHPVLGDTFYGPSQSARKTGRLMLHAETLEIFHPATGKIKRFCDPCPF